MALKPNIDVKAFFDYVHFSTGEVWFEINMGDRLNLKSRLSKCLFAAAFLSGDIGLTGKIVCDNLLDMELLQDFCD